MTPRPGVGAAGCRASQVAPGVQLPGALGAASGAVHREVLAKSGDHLFGLPGDAFAHANLGGKLGGDSDPGHLLVCYI